ncbi:chemotaxis protein CheX [Defluviitalea phaphyphila]|uniref:chemotaxis protein CheX n=1 Tax=Defluviitalea phaphyphila TaxID=1473580 RepID=UPI000A7FD31D|nr:chemotaxis protein CheX [Defluviitalea phaphyphila]
MSINVNFINPFIQGTQSILKEVCNEDSTLGKVYLKKSPYPSNTVVIIIGITGDVKGQVIFSLNIETACFIASKMMMGMNITELDEMAQSAISELTNMILGKTATIFYNKGVSIDITPPSLLMGDNMQISTSKMQTICIPLNLRGGNIFEIDVAIQENK